MSKRRRKLDDNSLETVFYYKESKKSQTSIPPGARSDVEDYEEDSGTTVAPTPSPRRASTLECKWCVTMCCGEDCVCANTLMPENTTVLQLPSNLTPVPSQPSTVSYETTTPESSRRGFSTRDYIKNVLTHDGDIGTILNDLVKVTLQKVEMMKKMDARASPVVDLDSDLIV